MYDIFIYFFFFFKQKTAYDMRISDWSSDVCSSDLLAHHAHQSILGLGADRQGIVAEVEELDVVGPQRLGGGLRLLAAGVLHALQGGSRILPQLGGFAALAERQADDGHRIALGGVQRDRSSGTPDKVSRMRADNQGSLARHRTLPFPSRVCVCLGLRLRLRPGVLPPGPRLYKKNRASIITFGYSW